MGIAFIFKKINVLGVGSSLGHLSIKNFSDWSFGLCPKTRKREGTGGAPYISNYEDDIQSFARE